MDYKYFHDGLISLSTTLFIFSLSFLFSSILLKPYIALEPDDRDLIVLLTIINMIFSIYYLIEAFNLERVFRLEEKYIRNFGIRIAVVSLLYLPHIFVFISLLLLHLHNLQVMMVWLILIIETLLLGILFKEIYDLLFKDEIERKFEIDQNRKSYLERK
jgi:Na+-driven multidrug efflux pump